MNLPVLKELNEREVPEEFYLYWAYASMTHNYAGKIALMLFALEALAKSKGDKHVILEEILGKELKDAAWRMRNQLAHGNSHKSNILYTDIHKKTIKYFNNNILENQRITEDFARPQRSSGAFSSHRSVVCSQNRRFDIVRILEDMVTDDVRPFVQGSTYDIGLAEEVTDIFRTY